MTEKQKSNSLALQNVISGAYTVKEAAEKLGLSVRRTQELVKAYHKKGALCCVHGNTGKHPVNCISEETRHSIVALAQSAAYKNYNVRQIHKKLKNTGIIISYNAVRNILKAANVKASRKYNVNMLFKDRVLAEGFRVYYAFVIRAAFLKPAHQRRSMLCLMKKAIL